MLRKIDENYYEHRRPGAEDYRRVLRITNKCWIIWSGNNPDVAMRVKSKARALRAARRNPPSEKVRLQRRYRDLIQEYNKTDAEWYDRRSMLLGEIQKTFRAISRIEKGREVRDMSRA